MEPEQVKPMSLVFSPVCARTRCRTGMSISTSESSSLVRRWSVCAKATTAMSLSGLGAGI